MIIMAVFLFWAANEAASSRNVAYAVFATLLAPRLLLR